MISLNNKLLKLALISLTVTLLISVTTAITEDEGQISVRDAGSTKERPRLDAYDLDEQTQDEIEREKQSFSFNADVSRLMDIIINSLYTKKDVFIRELISNASDALDKMRFIAVSHPEELGSNPELEVLIDFDYEQKTISITDTGVGMTKAELIKNLGTVAKSGTTAFLEAMGKGDNMSLIGQFGVGFYSAFLVANKVVVTSKSNDDDQHIWTSTADAKFFVTKDPRGNTLGRGTRVTLHLKDDAVEYVEQDKISNIVKRYSEFINYPIRLYLSRDERIQVPENEADQYASNNIIKQIKLGDEEEEEDDGVEIIDEGEEDEDSEPVMKTVTQQVWEWTVINEIKAIWLREKSDISRQEYDGFYRTITKDHEDPLAYTHFSAEGEIEFKAILFIPSSAPYDLFENYYGKSSALKLYVRRVLITEEFEELMPRYLNFIKGVVDSDDLPLNVSREQLQQMKMIKVMSKKLIRKALDMIATLADDDDDEDDYDEWDEEWDEDDEYDDDDEDEEEDEDDDDDYYYVNEKYNLFWENFGKNIKLGVIEDSSNRNRLAKLLRFHSTFDPEGWISLDEYISRMKDDQDTILYLPGDSIEGIQKSPILKQYVKQGYEILLLDEPIDEFCTQHLTEYERRKVKSIAKDDVSVLGNNDEVAKKQLQKLKEMYKPLTDWFQKHLGREVEKVQVSNKLTDDPVFILTSQYGYSAAMEKINKAQAFANQEKAANYMLAKKTLELNPHHPIIKELLKRVKEAGDDGMDQDTVDTADLMYNMALLNSGFLIDDPSDFTDPLHKMLKVNLGLDRYAQVEEIEIDVTEDEEEEEEDNELLRVKDKKGTIEIESLDEEESQYMHIHDDL